MTYSQVEMIIERLGRVAAALEKPQKELVFILLPADFTPERADELRRGLIKAFKEEE